MENKQWFLNIVWQSLSCGPSYLETNGVIYVSETKENNGAFVKYYFCDTILQAKPTLKKNV